MPGNRNRSKGLGSLASLRWRKPIGAAVTELDSGEVCLAENSSPKLRKITVSGPSASPTLFLLNRTSRNCLAEAFSTHRFSSRCLVEARSTHRFRRHGFAEAFFLNRISRGCLGEALLPERVFFRSSSLASETDSVLGNPRRWDFFPVRTRRNPPRWAWNFTEWFSEPNFGDSRLTEAPKSSATRMFSGSNRPEPSAPGSEFHRVVFRARAWGSLTPKAPPSRSRHFSARGSPG